MNTKLLLAGLLISGSQAMAADTVIPTICKSAANYAAQALDLGFSDGTFSNAHDPNSELLKKDFKTYPVSNVTYLGNCEEDGPKLKDSWCRVAGGSPDVFQVDVAIANKDGSYPFATMIVTYNRGGCWVDEAARK